MKGQCGNVGEKGTRRTLAIPRFPAPFVDINKGHEFWRNSGVGEVCCSSPVKKTIDFVSVVSFLRRGLEELGFSRRRHTRGLSLRDDLKLVEMNVVGNELLVIEF